MATMLKHKETGELFIFTADLAKNEFLEPVVVDPVAEAIASLETPAQEARTPVAKTTKKFGGK